MKARPIHDAATTLDWHGVSASKVNPLNSHYLRRISPEALPALDGPSKTENPPVVTLLICKLDQHGSPFTSHYKYRVAGELTQFAFINRDTRFLIAGATCHDRSGTRLGQNLHWEKQ